MKSTVENLSPTRVRLAVEVPFDGAEAQPRRRVQEDRLAAAHPGLPSRQGAGPRHRPAGRPRRGAEEAVNDALPRVYTEAAREHELRPLGPARHRRHQPRRRRRLALHFTAEVDVRPEITLPELDGLAVTVDDVEVDRRRRRRAARRAARPVRHAHRRRPRRADRRLRLARPGRRGRRRADRGRHRPRACPTRSARAT